MLKIKDLDKSVGTRKILKSININVEEGMIYGFIGHNGAGKTTTMKSIVGLTGFESGEIIIDGKAYRNKVSIGQTIGYLPESPSFYGYMTAFEYLTYVSGGQDKKTILDIIERVGLGKARKKRISTYSRGMKQRLGMGAAMIHHPKLMIMDEPTSALDPAGRYELFDMIKTLRDEGSTIILSTHILDDVERVSDRIGIIKEGQVLSEDTVGNVLSKYVHPIFDVDLRVGNENIDKMTLESLKEKTWINQVDWELNRLTITVGDMESGEVEILKTLAETGLPVIGFQKRKPTLEEVFMKEIRL